MCAETLSQLCRKLQRLAGAAEHTVDLSFDKLFYHLEVSRVSTVEGQPANDIVDVDPDNRPLYFGAALLCGV